MSLIKLFLVENNYGISVFLDWGRTLLYKAEVFPVRNNIFF
jgi:hypothetical protein